MIIRKVPPYNLQRTSNDTLLNSYLKLLKKSDLRCFINFSLLQYGMSISDTVCLSPVFIESLLHMNKVVTWPMKLLLIVATL